MLDGRHWTSGSAESLDGMMGQKLNVVLME